MPITQVAVAFPSLRLRRLCVLGLAGSLGAGAYVMLQPDVPDATPSPAVRIGACHETDPLPAWFGLRGAPAQAIAGRLLSRGKPVAGTVHLRIEAPDATVWSGRDIETGPDGRFDFGLQRTGRYYLVGMVDGQITRTFLVDTTVADANHVTLDLLPCAPLDGVVTSESGRPVDGAAIDLAGVHLATTDARGRYHTCILPGSTSPVVRSDGSAAMALIPLELGLAAGSTSPMIRDVQLAVPEVLRGHVTWNTGEPAVGVGVFPLDEGSRTLSGSTPPVQGVTDAHGDFSIAGVPSAATSRYGYRMVVDALEVVAPNQERWPGPHALAPLKLQSY